MWEHCTGPHAATRGLRRPFPNINSGSLPARAQSATCTFKLNFRKAWNNVRLILVISSEGAWDEDQFKVSVSSNIFSLSSVAYADNQNGFNKYILRAVEDINRNCRMFAA